MTGWLNNCLVKAKGEKFEMQFSKFIFCNFDETFFLVDVTQNNDNTFSFVI